MEEEYMKRLLKRIQERKAKHNMLCSKRRLLKETEKEIKELEEGIADLDNKINVLTPSETPHNTPKIPEQKSMEKK